jgi:hypothetical protein
MLADLELQFFMKCWCVCVCPHARVHVPVIFTEIILELKEISVNLQALLR